MKALELSSQNLATRIFWKLLAALAVAAVLYSAWQILSFSIKQWSVFVGLGIISMIVSQYRIKLPRTRMYVSVREMVIFLAMVWIGIGGSVLLALIAALGNHREGSKDTLRWTADISLISVTTFVSGTVLYAVLNHGFGFKPYPVADSPINALLFFGALALAGAVHYGLYSGLFSLFLKLEGSYPVGPLWKENALLGTLFSAVCIVCVFGFHLLVVYFGLLFGLLVLPMVIFGHLALSFHKQLLAQKTKEIREASRIHLATVEALATAIDARDQVGLGHVSRTQIYAIGIGKVMNLSDDDLEALNTGALLHDIGKLAVPDHILNKPGRLTPAEMEKTKIHASVGASILEKIGFPYPVVPTVRHHHERWDGSGYPEGLAKEEIPLTARVLSVADAYDTLRGARPYRKAVSRDEARRFLISEAGKQFDPRIVDIFLRNLRNFEREVVAQGLSYLDEADAAPEATARIESHVSYVEQIKRANREVFTLYELARVFGASLNLEDTMSLFVKKIAELVPFDTCAVYLLSETETVANAKFVAGKNKEELKNRKVQVGQGATGYALKKRQPVYNVNPGLDFSFYQMEFIQEYTAMASLPLIANEKLVGAVSLYTSQLEAYEDEHMRLLETVSRIASDAILASLRHAETETRAMTDPMTSLPNARSLQMQFEKEMARAKRNGSSFQVLMLDLDGFKKVNDTFGHKAGDQLLREISLVMLEQLRDYDFLARYAGDEFVAIVPETDNKMVAELCHRLEKAVREFRLDVGDGRVARVGVSLGAAAYPNSGETLDKIIIAADKAMYAVKARRKARAKQARMAKIQEQKRREAERRAAEAPIQVREVMVEKPSAAQEPVPAEVVDAVEVVDDVEVVEEQNVIVDLDESSIISSKAIN